MNLAVHDLEGDIRQAITYYEDPHELVGKADYVMANPPFNVDEIDAEKVKADPRLPFGLPGVNRRARVSNGNYVWISYFHNYLNRNGRAGFVMSSQASSAGGAEAAVRRKLVETGDVEVMIAIRSNFFYTRTAPCELWFLNRAKPERRRGKVLMIDARAIFRKVTRKIYDFSPEQMRNLLAIVHLYREQTGRFLGPGGRLLPPRGARRGRLPGRRRRLPRCAGGAAGRAGARSADPRRGPQPNRSAWRTGRGARRLRARGGRFRERGGRSRPDAELRAAGPSGTSTRSSTTSTPNR